MATSNTAPGSASQGDADAAELERFAEQRVKPVMREMVYALMRDLPEDPKAFMLQWLAARMENTNGGLSSTLSGQLVPSPAAVEHGRESRQAGRKSLTFDDFRRQCSVQGTAPASVSGTGRRSSVALAGVELRRLSLQPAAAMESPAAPAEANVSSDEEDSDKEDVSFDEYKRRCSLLQVAGQDAPVVGNDTPSESLSAASVAAPLALAAGSSGNGQEGEKELTFAQYRRRCTILQLAGHDSASGSASSSPAALGRRASLVRQDGTKSEGFLPVVRGARRGSDLQLAGMAPAPAASEARQAPLDGESERKGDDEKGARLTFSQYRRHSTLLELTGAAKPVRIVAAPASVNIIDLSGFDRLVARLEASADRFGAPQAAVPASGGCGIDSSADHIDLGKFAGLLARIERAADCLGAKTA